MHHAAMAAGMNSSFAELCGSSVLTWRTTLQYQVHACSACVTRLGHTAMVMGSLPLHAQQTFGYIENGTCEAPACSECASRLRNSMQAAIKVFWIA
jgi:hypothetical protein